MPLSLFPLSLFFFDMEGSEKNKSITYSYIVDRGGEDREAEEPLVVRDLGRRERQEDLRDVRCCQLLGRCVGDACPVVCMRTPIRNDLAYSSAALTSSTVDTSTAAAGVAGAVRLNTAVAASYPGCPGNRTAIRSARR